MPDYEFKCSGCGKQAVVHVDTEDVSLGQIAAADDVRQAHHFEKETARYTPQGLKVTNIPTDLKDECPTLAKQHNYQYWNGERWMNV